MIAKIEALANADAIGLKRNTTPTRSKQPTGNFFMAFLAWAAVHTDKHRQKLQSRLKNIFQSRTLRPFERKSWLRPTVFTFR
jgi:hypothetical protein